MILVCLKLILYAAIPFRGLSKSLKILNISKYYNVHKVPSHTTTRRWMNRLGLYHLKREKDHADDWCYIVDNSIRIENRKLCLILGVRLSKLKTEGYVTFEDVEIIEIGLIQGKAKEGVTMLLESAISKTGMPLEICSDQGPDVIPAIKCIISKYPSIKHVPDVIHATTNMLKKILEKQTRWEKFSKQVGITKNKLKQSSHSELCPPQIRGKSRFLNCGVIIDWAMQVIELLEKKNCDKGMREKLEWLLMYKDDLKEMHEMIEIVRLANELVRSRRINSTTWLIAKILFEEEAKSKKGQQLSKQIVEFLKRLSDLAGGNFLIGSSEVIESAFGKLKSLDRECGNSGFTSSILGIGACFGKLDYETIAKAINNTSDKDVDEWKKNQVGETHYSKRRKLLKSKKTEDLNKKLTRILEEKRCAA
jgi:hypothetical protein